LRTAAKLQLGTTHELASVPYIPAPQLLARKFAALGKLGVDGYLGCWIFGGDMTPMSVLAGKMSRLPQPKARDAVLETAAETFGPDRARAVARAWGKFSSAWRLYPFSVPFLYFGPINYATAYPLALEVKAAPLVGGFRPLPRDAAGHIVWGDNASTWLKPFSPDEFIAAFDAMAAVWKEGEAILAEACGLGPGCRRLRLEWNLAKHILLTLRSMANIIRFHRSHAEGFKDMDGLRRLFADEAENARADLPLLRFDPRLGFHPEANCHLFTAADLEHKISLLERSFPGENG